MPSTNGHQDGVEMKVTNGHATTGETRTNTSVSLEETRKSRTEKHTYESSSTFSSEQQITILRQTVTATRVKLICELRHVNEYDIDSMTVESFLEYIESERLTNMPQRGSRWDKVLKWAEFFALQISGYEKALERFVPHSMNAAQLIWASCRALIEVKSVPLFGFREADLNSLDLRTLKPSKPPLPYSTKSAFHSHSFSSTISCLIKMDKSERRLGKHSTIS